MAIDFKDPTSWDQDLSDADALSLAIFALNTLKYPDATSREDATALDFFTEGAIDRLVALRDTDEVDWKQRFIDLFIDVAACEAPEGTQVDGVLGDHQSAFDLATGQDSTEWRSKYTLYYVSADGPAEGSTWTVYRELYMTHADDCPIDGSQERVGTYPSEAEADAEAQRLQAESSSKEDDLP